MNNDNMSCVHSVSTKACHHMTGNLDCSLKDSKLVGTQESQMRRFRHRADNRDLCRSRTTASLRVLLCLGSILSVASQGMGLCEGDCKGDEFNCDFGLSCFVRDSKEEVVPGCENETGSKDLCYEPPPGTLVYAGDNDGDTYYPDGAFPLGECEGDCDDNKDCAKGLECMARDAFEGVPGCDGRGVKGRDYCYDPSKAESNLSLPKEKPPPTKSPKKAKPQNTPSPSTAKPKKNKKPTESPAPETAKPNKNKKPTESPQSETPAPSEEEPKKNKKPSESPSPEESSTTPPGLATLQLLDDLTLTPYQECEGNCTANDSFCDMGLSCFVRNNKKKIPGCAGRGVKAGHYCYKPPPGVLVFVSGIKDVLDKCEGNCKTKEDCKTGLECFTRTFDEAVPGCAGLGIHTMGYCFDAADAGTATTTEAPTQTPTKEEANTPTSQPSTAPPSPSPTETGSTKPPTLAPSLKPTMTSTETSLKELKTIDEPPMLGLGECEGGCSGDDLLCDFGFSCFVRAGVDAVPGCQGQGDSGVNYCYKPPPDVLVYTADDFDTHMFPLKACQGDCDVDDDCEGELKCMLRDSFEAVPGCNGRGIVGRDYCHDPNAPAAPPTPSGSNGGEGGIFPPSSAFASASVASSILFLSFSLVLCFV